MLQISGCVIIFLKEMKPAGSCYPALKSDRKMDSALHPLIKGRNIQKFHG